VAVARTTRWQALAPRARELVQAAHSAEAGLRCYTRLNRLRRREGQILFLACMPKSGSTFTRRVLSEATGYEYVDLSYAYERTEQDLYLPKVIDAYGRSGVDQLHIRPSAANLEIMRRFHIRPVILTRNLYDAVVSLRDNMFAGGGVENYPMLYATPSMAELDQERLADFVIAHAIPWYVNFYASWQDEYHGGSVEALWVTYEELQADWATGIGKILDFYEIAKPRVELEGVIARLERDGRAPGTPYETIRYNKGVVGRGNELTEAQRARVRELTQFYPWVDFTPVGI
jgi:hypothetical protein